MGSGHSKDSKRRKQKLKDELAKKQN